MGWNGKIYRIILGIVISAMFLATGDLAGQDDEYMKVVEGEIELDSSRFALAPDTAGGFFSLTERLAGRPGAAAAVKGQITGPFTLGTGIADQNKRAIFYDEQLRDAAVKLLAMKARWQVRRLSQYVRPVLIFIDEPGLAGFGSSEFTSQLIISIHISSPASTPQSFVSFCKLRQIFSSASAIWKSASRISPSKTGVQPS